MEVLEVSGYVSEEKAVIADKYLGPQAKEASGLKDADVQLDSAAIDVLIKYYCRESGVRNLKKHIDKVCLLLSTTVSCDIHTIISLQIYRKAALKLVQDLGEDVFPEPTAPSATASASAADTKTVEKQDAPQSEPSAPETSPPLKDASSTSERVVTTAERRPLVVPDSVHVRISPENLKDYVGPPVYHKDRMYVHTPPPGVSTGLGYLGNGSGAVMPIEVTVCTLRFPSARRPDPNNP